MRLFAYQEEWLQIEGFDYAVSNHGRVRRTTDENNTWAGRILRLKIDPNGYSIVVLSRCGIPHDRKVHRLVCEAFNGKPPVNGGYFVRHLDGNPQNNNPINLKWGTGKQNAEDRARHGRDKKGEQHCRALFSDSEVDEMRQKYKAAKQRAVTNGKKYVPRGFIDVLAKQKNVDRSTLHRILSGVGYETVR